MFSSKSLFIIPSTLAIPVYIPPEEIEVGQAVFHNFIHDELEHEGLSDEAFIEDSTDIISVVHQSLAANSQGNYNSILIKNIGRSIREVASEFAQSSQREQIRVHANEVDLRHLTFDRFWGMLEEVFRHGINVYNIVALFYFCSDILIKSVKQEMIKLGINLFKWSLKYIVEQVCRWVHEHGGWENALKSIWEAKRYFAYGTVAIIMCAFGWGLYKGWRN